MTRRMKGDPNLRHHQGCKCGCGKSLLACACSQCCVTQTSAGIFLLCDRARVLKYFENALRADQLLRVPDLLEDCTTPVLRVAIKRRDAAARKQATAGRQHVFDQSKIGRASCRERV